MRRWIIRGVVWGVVIAWLWWGPEWMVRASITALIVEYYLASIWMDLSTKVDDHQNDMLRSLLTIIEHQLEDE